MIISSGQTLPLLFKKPLPLHFNPKKEKQCLQELLKQPVR